MTFKQGPKKVGFTVYPVTEMARARDFYETKLGLTPGAFSNAEWQEYDLGGTTFALDSAPMPFLKPGSQGNIAFEYQDLKSLVLSLSASGVEFIEEMMETKVCHMAWIRDPDGNVVCLHQLKR